MTILIDKTMQPRNNIIKSNCVPEVYSDTGGGPGALKCSSSREYYGDGQIVENGSLAMSRFGGGYFDSDGSTFYYFSDYQGNNISVVDNKGNVCQSTDYYPYGEVWRLDNSLTLGTKNTFLYSDKEYLSMDGLHEYDFSARRQTPAVPGFNRIDPDCEKYYDINPYVFCASNPVNAIDPSGKLTIFINGMHGGSGASSEYWGGVDETVMKAVGETKAIYKDGSMGGAISLIIRCLPVPTVLSVANTSINPNKRILGGYIDGMMSAKTIKSELGKNEKIRFVSHSMGAAYTKGFIGGMKLILGDDIVKSIEFELDIAPYQPKLQKAVKGVKTVVLQHEEDKLALPLEMKGAEQIKKKSNQSILDAHSISSFKADIEKLFENY